MKGILALIARHPARLGGGVLAEISTAGPHPHLDTPEMILAIRQGLPLAEFDALREMLGLTVEQMAAKVGISIATLSRRRLAGEPLDPAHSDRVVRYARLYWQAADYFELREDAARAWLTRPAASLGGETPLDYAETEAGGREVEHVLGRLEHGVYL